MLDLRQLFDKYRIPWKDRGANTSRYCVNICCPFCGSSDQGFHLGVQKDGEGYFCLRNPKHNGRNLYKLFRLLNIPDKAWTGQIKSSNSTWAEQTKQDRSYTAFQYFEPAETSDEACSYLFTRGFCDPVATCKKFNLKVAKNGKWVGRLIIPLTIGWTGRGMRGQEIRYLSETDELGAFEAGNARASSIMLLEGPLDAMRLASVSNLILFHANLGKRLTASLIVQIRLRGYTAIYYAPDGDVDKFEQIETVDFLASYCTQQVIKTMHFPKGKKDACEMSEIEARRWLLTQTTEQPYHQFV